MTQNVHDPAKPAKCPGRYNGADGRCVYCRGSVKRRCQAQAAGRQTFGDPLRGVEVPP